MEASGAALASGGDAQAAAGGPAEAAGPDISQLAQDLQSNTAGLEELRQFLSNQPWQQQAQAPAETDAAGEVDLSFLEDATGMDSATLAAQLAPLISQATQPVVKQMEAMQTQLKEEKWKSEAQSLVDEFPELGDEKVATPVVAMARQLAEANNRPDLANEPWFWRMTYMAGRAAEQANAEGAQAPAAAHLEGGGGAMPSGGQVDVAQQILDARGARKTLPFG